MKLEDQVITLEHAIKLKELGIKQESYFYYVYSRKDEDDDKKENIVICKKEIPDSYELFELRNSDSKKFASVYGFGCECCNVHFKIDTNKIYSAFTASELGEFLRKINFTKDLEIDYYTTYDEYNFVVKQNKVIGFESVYLKEKIEVNGRAKLIIYLIENKLINFPVNQLCIN